MDKQEVILWLKENFRIWHGVYSAACVAGYKFPDGWWIAFDGDSVNDMYLTNAHPLGDESGDIITKRDFLK